MIRRFGLMSDTHGMLHADVPRIFHDVEAILHAGDVCGDEILAELNTIAPTYAVQGNCDGSGNPLLPPHRIVPLPFGNVGIAHGHRQDNGDQATRVKVLLTLFAPMEPRLIIHGHSHLQYLECRKGIHIVNPGAACRPRLNTYASVCLMEWDQDHDLLRFDFQPLIWK
ncbi:metallophosphoesterase family protein [soil metagenome]